MHLRWGMGTRESQSDGWHSFSARIDRRKPSCDGQKNRRGLSPLSVNELFPKRKKGLRERSISFRGPRFLKSPRSRKPFSDSTPAVPTMGFRNSSISSTRSVSAEPSGIGEMLAARRKKNGGSGILRRVYSQRFKSTDEASVVEELELRCVDNAKTIKKLEEVVTASAGVIMKERRRYNEHTVEMNELKERIVRMEALLVFLGLETLANGAGKNSEYPA